MLEQRHVKTIGHTTRSGLVVKPKDAEGLAEAVVRLCENRKLAAELGRNGYRYVSENLTTQKIGKRMYELFASIAFSEMFER